MDIESFRKYCLTFKGSEEALPFDETTLVFKVKGKIFALTDIDAFDLINVKCDPEEAILLREQYEGVIPGFHMNKKHWNSILMDKNIPDHLIKKWIKNSYDLVVSSLSKKLQMELYEG